MYEYLKNNGLDPELANFENKTPLHVTVILKNSFFLGELRSNYKVTTRTKDNDGKMPIDYTVKNSPEYSSLVSED